MRAVSRIISVAGFEQEQIVQMIIDDRTRSRLIIEQLIYCQGGLLSRLDSIININMSYQNFNGLKTRPSVPPPVTFDTTSIVTVFETGFMTGATDLAVISTEPTA